MVPRVDHMDIRDLQQPWNAEAQMEQGPSAQYRSEVTGFEEAGVEGWCAEERCNELTWFGIFLCLRPCGL